MCQDFASTPITDRAYDSSNLLLSMRFEPPALVAVRTPAQGQGTAAAPLPGGRNQGGSARRAFVRALGGGLGPRRHFPSHIPFLFPGSQFYFAVNPGLSPFGLL